MTKQALQQELKEKVKAGVKPSDLKKLKRSKSADDIPQTPASVPLKKSQSQLEIPLQPSLKEQITQLQEQVHFHAETAANYLKSLQASQARVSELEEELKNNPPNQLLQDQLQTKQQEIEKLREKLEVKNEELNSLKAQHSSVLDSNLELKHQSLKDWWQQYEKTKELEQELKENVGYASEELISQDQTISQLRSQINQLKQTNQSLQKDLNLAEKLAELRSSSFPTSSTYPYLKYALYTLVAVWFSWFISKNLSHDR